MTWTGSSSTCSAISQPITAGAILASAIAIAAALSSKAHNRDIPETADSEYRQFSSRDCEKYRTP